MKRYGFFAATAALLLLSAPMYPSTSGDAPSGYVAVVSASAHFDAMLPSVIAFPDSIRAAHTDLPSMPSSATSFAASNADVARYFETAKVPMTAAPERRASRYVDTASNSPAEVRSTG